MDCCPDTSFIYPLLADIYYPEVSQGAYGAVSKSWMLNKTVAGNFSTAGRKTVEEVSNNVNVSIEGLLLGRVRSDIRITDENNNKSITNIVVTNIRDKFGNIVYLETAGPREGKATLFEVATQQPQLGPFGTVDFYKVILRRSENQGTDI